MKKREKKKRCATFATLFSFTDECLPQKGCSVANSPRSDHREDGMSSFRGMSSVSTGPSWREECE